MAKNNAAADQAAQAATDAAPAKVTKTLYVLNHDRRIVGEDGADAVFQKGVPLDLRPSLVQVAVSFGAEPVEVEV